MDDGQRAITEKDLSRWKLIESFQEALAPVLEVNRLHPSFEDPDRLLRCSSYLSLFLFGVFNPVIQSMRAVCAISSLKKVQGTTGAGKVSLGSFSEVQHLLEPDLLKQVFERLVDQMPAGSAATEKLRTIRPRLVEVKRDGQPPLHCHQSSSANDLRRSGVADLPIYRRRWPIELFFRWIKFILGCRHFLAESPKGVAIQLYLALIAAVLLQLFIGHRPNKRTMELLQFYIMGRASAEEVVGLIQRQAKAKPTPNC